MTKPIDFQTYFNCLKDKEKNGRDLKPDEEHDAYISFHQQWLAHRWLQEETTVFFNQLPFGKSALVVEYIRIKQPNGIRYYVQTEQDGICLVFRFGKEKEVMRVYMDLYRWNPKTSVSFEELDATLLTENEKNKLPELIQLGKTFTESYFERKRDTRLKLVTGGIIFHDTDL